MRGVGEAEILPVGLGGIVALVSKDGGRLQPAILAHGMDLDHRDICCGCLDWLVWRDIIEHR